MARPLRIEYAGALYHITSRGNAQQEIFLNDDHRASFLDTLAKTCERQKWLCHAYCLMSNHYHLLIETQAASLSKGMKILNGSYTQYFNRNQSRVGHVFQGRFKAILVERDSHLLELCRYVVLNPVRARMVRSAKDWPWSSYRATAGLSRAHAVLSMDWILGNFGRREKIAQEKYRAFVLAGKGQPSPWEKLKNQVFLGSDQFIEESQSHISQDQSLDDIPKLQKLAPPKPLSHYAQSYSEKEGMARAYLSGHYTLADVGAVWGKSYARVSRAVKNFEEDLVDVKCKA